MSLYSIVTVYNFSQHLRVRFKFNFHGFQNIQVITNIFGAEKEYEVGMQNISDLFVIDLDTGIN